MSADVDHLAGIDDDELDDDGSGRDDREPGATEGRYVCDVDGCGANFDKASSLGLHKFRTHGIKGARRGGSAKSSSSSSRSDASPRRKGDRSSGRQRLIRESILEVLDTRRAFRGEEFEQPLDVEGTLRRDVDRIAAALAGLAERDLFSFLGPVIDRLLGAGGPVSIFRAFAPTLRSLFAHRREAVATKAAEQAAFEQHYAQLQATEGQEAADAFAERYRNGEVIFQ